MSLHGTILTVLNVALAEKSAVHIHRLPLSIAAQWAKPTIIIRGYITAYLIQQIFHQSQHDVKQVAYSDGVPFHNGLASDMEEGSVQYVSRESVNDNLTVVNLILPGLRWSDNACKQMPSGTFNHRHLKHLRIQFKGKVYTETTV